MLLDKLGGYLPPGSLGPNDITSLVVGIIQANGAPLVDIYLGRDVQNKSRYAIIVDLPRDVSNHGSLYTLNMFDTNVGSYILFVIIEKIYISEKKLLFTFYSHLIIVIQMNTDGSVIFAKKVHITNI